MTNLRTIPDQLLHASQSIVFDDSSHTYAYCPDAASLPAPLTSVTKIAKSYSHPFDAAAHSLRISERDGVDQQSILDNWKKISDEAAGRGTCVHKQIERICNDLQLAGPTLVRPALNEGEYQDTMYTVWCWFAEHMELAQGWVMPEVRICHPGYGMAGTVDLLASNYRGVPAIVDWKTSKEIEVCGYSNMLPPFTRGRLALPDANYYHFCLQLSLYRFMLETRYGFFPEVCVVIHLTDNGYTEYEVPYLTSHLNLILKELNNGEPETTIDAGGLREMLPGELFEDEHLSAPHRTCSGL